MKVLKTKYCNLKSELKKRAAEERKSLYITSGAPAMIQESGEFDVVLREIVPEKQVHGNKSMYDSDFIEIESFSVSNDMKSKHPSGFHKDATCETTLIELDKQLKDSDSWENFPPQQIKTKTTKKLSCEGKRKGQQFSWAQLEAVKIKCLNDKMSQEVEFAKAAHELRMQQMKDMHNVQIQTLKMQKKFLVEKHEMEMRILEEKSKKAHLNSFGK